MTNDKLQMTNAVRTKDFVSWFVIRHPLFVIHESSLVISK